MAKFVGSLNVPTISTAPLSASEGDVYYDTTADDLLFYVNSSWTPVGTIQNISAGAGISVSGSGDSRQVSLESFASSSSSGTPGTSFVKSLSSDVYGRVISYESGSVQNASTTAAGIVQLSDSISTTSSILAATPTAVKSAYDLAGTKNRVYYQTSTPTGGSYAVGDIWVDSDSVIGGPLTLTDSISSTSTTTAATPKNVKTAYDIATAGWEAFTFGTSGIIGTHPRFVLQTTSTTSSGVIYHTKIIPHRDFTVSNIAFVSTATTATTPTLIRFGIYTRSGTTFTLVARTASDTTIFNAANTKFTRALDTAGGYPATYTLTAGAEYWVSNIQVASASASLLSGLVRQSTAANAATGFQFYSQTSQADLAASSTGSGNINFAGFYAEVS